MSEVLPPPRDAGWAPESYSDLQYSMAQVLGSPVSAAVEAYACRCTGRWEGTRAGHGSTPGACRAIKAQGLLPPMTQGTAETAIWAYHAASQAHKHAWGSRCSRRTATSNMCLCLTRGTASVQHRCQTSALRPVTAQCLPAIMQPACDLVQLASLSRRVQGVLGRAGLQDNARGLVCLRAW